MPMVESVGPQLGAGMEQLPLVMVVRGAFDGMIGLLACSSGHGGGYKVVVGVGDCF